MGIIGLFCLLWPAYLHVPAPLMLKFLTFGCSKIAKKLFSFFFSLTLSVYSTLCFTQSHLMQSILRTLVQINCNSFSCNFWIKTIWLHQSKEKTTILNLLVFTLCFTLATISSCFYKHLKIPSYSTTRCLKL